MANRHRQKPLILEMMVVVVGCLALGLWIMRPFLAQTTDDLFLLAGESTTTVIEIPTEIPPGATATAPITTLTFVIPGTTIGPTFPAPIPTFPVPTTAPGVVFLAAAEAEIATSTNQLRVQEDLSPLAADTGLHVFARNCSSRMAEQGQISHSDLGPLLDDWQVAGENIGVSGDAGDLFDALVESPSHYSIMVDVAYTHLGVGAAIDTESQLWVCEVFTGPIYTPPPSTTVTVPEPPTTLPDVTLPTLP